MPFFHQNRHIFAIFPQKNNFFSQKTFLFPKKFTIFTIRMANLVTNQPKTQGCLQGRLELLNAQSSQLSILAVNKLPPPYVTPYFARGYGSILIEKLLSLQQ